MGLALVLEECRVEGTHRAQLAKRKKRLKTAHTREENVRERERSSQSIVLTQDKEPQGVVIFRSITAICIHDA